MRIISWCVVVLALAAAAITATLVQTRWLSQSLHWGFAPDGTSQLMHDGSTDPAFLAFFVSPYAGLVLLAWLTRRRRIAPWGLLVATLLIAALGYAFILPDISESPMGNHGKGLAAMLTVIVQAIPVAVAVVVYAVIYFAGNRRVARGSLR